MTDEKMLESQARIVTEIKIPHDTVMKFIRGLFPELGVDAYIGNWSGNPELSIDFKINHTIQAAINRAPILLTVKEPDDTSGKD